MRQLAQKSCSWPWLKLTSNEKHFGDITNPGSARSGIFLRCMKLAIYRFGLFLFIAVLLPRTLPGGPHDVTSAVLRRKEPLSTARRSFAGWTLVGVPQLEAV